MAVEFRMGMEHFPVHVMLGATLVLGGGKLSTTRPRLQCAPA